MQLENNLRAVSSLLRRILPAALDADTFAIASSPITDQGLLDKAISVLQNGAPSSPTITQLSSPQSPVVAVVDRTANIETAARELVALRFGFGGHSPYAPDVVLINEFRKSDFFQAVVNECIRFTGSGIKSSEKKTPASSKIADQISSLTKSDSDLRIIFQAINLAVVDLVSRPAAEVLLTNTKLSSPILAVHSIKSLDDAIDLVGSSGKTCVAAYHFGNAATGKYLAQFVNAEVSFINHIPRELLLGPTAPSGGKSFENGDASTRYPIDFFTVARPAYISTSLKKSVPPLSSAAGLLAAALSSPDNEASRKLLEAASSPLQEKKRNPGGGVGFFEQGFLLSAGIILSSIVVGSISSAVWFWVRRR